MNVTSLKSVTHEKLPGISIFPLNGEMKAGKEQEVLVIAEPNCVIPLHQHGVDAHMTIVAGDAELLSSEETMNGIRVQTGDVVFFEKNVDHGFRAGSNGLRFISSNGGIVDKSGNWDMQLTEVA